MNYKKKKKIPPSENPGDFKMEKKTKFSSSYFLLVFFGILLLDSLFFSGYQTPEISYKEFRDKITAGKVESVVITQNKIFGLYKEKKQGPVANKSIVTKNASVSKKGIKPIPKFTPWRLRIEKQHKEDIKRQFMVSPLKDPKLLEILQAHNVDYRGRIDNNWLKHFILNWIIPFIIFSFLWRVFINKIGNGPRALNIGKNKAKIYAEDPKNKTTFKDIAGVDEAVEEVKEVVEFLKTPKKFTQLGAKLPKGILLVGPPGTGKTLLAKAVAGEAEVPFFSLSGSDFIEMFVGVGAARVRDLFIEARMKAPCIIFIDEIDAIGKNRGHGAFVGGYDERENTLNQILTEMDGFDSKLGIIIMGATNRADVLDPALLRPGRFDRQVLVDRPDLKGRENIFAIHTKILNLADDVDLHKLASQVPGFAGADIANVCNEAALLASRKGKEQINFGEFQEAIERLIAGLEKKNKLINPHERKIVAYHESGHAIVGHFTKGSDPVQKITIVPHGLGALGYTLQTPLEDRYLMSESELLGRITGLLGGRASEETIFNEVSTGASNDLEKASNIARSMIEVYGMSKNLTNLSFVQNKENDFLHSGMSETKHSEKTEQIIDEEIKAIITKCYKAAKQLLEKNRDKLESMAQQLLEKENLNEEEINKILGLRPDNVKYAA